MKVKITDITIPETTKVVYKDFTRPDSWIERFNNTFAINNEEIVTFGVEGLKQFIQKELDKQREELLIELPKDVEDLFDKRVAENQYPLREWFLGYNKALNECRKIIKLK